MFTLVTHLLSHKYATHYCIFCITDRSTLLSVMTQWSFDVINEKLGYHSQTAWHTVQYKLLCPRGTQTCVLAVANIKVNGNGKVILDTHTESDQHQNWTCSRGWPSAPTHQIWWWSMNLFLRYLADKQSAQTHRQTHADDHKTLRSTARR